MILIIQLFILFIIMNTYYELLIITYNYELLKSLQFHEIVKMNTITFIFRARKNVLPINLQKLYSIKYIIPIYFID